MDASTIDRRRFNLVVLEEAAERFQIALLTCPLNGTGIAECEVLRFGKDGLET